MPYDVGEDPYIDPAIGILRNLLGLTTQSWLDTAEAEITSVQIATLFIEDKPSLDSYTWELLCDLHYYIFGDIYDWAGQPRIIELSKDTTSFARAAHITASAEQLFSDLKKENYLQALARDAFITKLAHYYAELNVLHPFREGNGRVTRTLLYMLAEKVGYRLAWNNMNAQENISASIAAYHGDENPLREMLEQIVS